MTILESLFMIVISIIMFDTLQISTHIYNKVNVEIKCHIYKSVIWLVVEWIVAIMSWCALSNQIDIKYLVFSYFVIILSLPFELILLVRGVQVFELVVKYLDEDLI